MTPDDWKAGMANEAASTEDAHWARETSAALWRQRWSLRLLHLALAWTAPLVLTCLGWPLLDRWAAQAGPDTLLGHVALGLTGNLPSTATPPLFLEWPAWIAAWGVWWTIKFGQQGQTGSGWLSLSATWGALLGTCGLARLADLAEPLSPSLALPAAALLGWLWWTGPAQGMRSRA